MTRRLRRFLVYPLAAALPALGLMISLSTSAGATTTEPTSSASTVSASTVSTPSNAAARAALRHLAIGQHGTNHKVASSSRNLKGLAQVQSTNWSGYADTGSSFSKVSSSWTEPSATCPSGGREQLAAFWVGIDGYSSNSVEQDGTLIECLRGSAFHYTWWEMYPSNAIQVVGSSAAAGDAITATVTRSGGSYTLSVTDSTHTADSFSTTQSCSSCANTSAEWIAEAPSSGTGILPLANFGTWNATGASVTEGSSSGTISSFTDDEITMVDNAGAVKAQPGPLNSGGNAFSVAWKSAT